MGRRHTVAAAAAALLVGTTILVCAPPPTAAHSALYSPKPNHPSDCANIPGRRLRCVGHGETACPQTKDPDGVGGSSARPAAIYARAQRVTFLYYKNNHAPVGFVRWSLVPARRYQSVAAHAAMAFWWNCWGSGFHDCAGDACGTDKKGHAWSAAVTIPTSIPDGDYVLGWTWYGGGDGNDGARLRFDTFWSCAFVRIHGGPQTPSWAPRFVTLTGRTEPGTRGSAAQQRRQCLSGVDRLGVCDTVTPACRRRPIVYRTPYEFSRGRQPAPLTTKRYHSVRRWGAGGAWLGRFWH